MQLWAWQLVSKYLWDSAGWFSKWRKIDQIKFKCFVGEGINKTYGSVTEGESDINYDWSTDSRLSLFNKEIQEFIKTLVENSEPLAMDDFLLECSKKNKGEHIVNEKDIDKIVQESGYVDHPEELKGEEKKFQFDQNYNQLVLINPKMFNNSSKSCTLSYLQSHINNWFYFKYFKFTKLCRINAFDTQEKFKELAFTMSIRKYI